MTRQDFGLDAIDNGVEAVEAKLDDQDFGLDAIDNGVESLESKLDDSTSGLVAIKSATDSLEAKSDSLLQKSSEIQQQAEAQATEEERLFIQKCLADCTMVFDLFNDCEKLQTVMSIVQEVVGSRRVNLRARMALMTAQRLLNGCEGTSLRRRVMVYRLLCKAYRQTLGIRPPCSSNDESGIGLLGAAFLMDQM